MSYLHSSIENSWGAGCGSDSSVCLQGTCHSVLHTTGSHLFACFLPGCGDTSAKRRLRPFGPVPGPRAPRSPPTQATREAAWLRRPVRSWILAGTRCAACGDTEREKGVTAGAPEESGGRGGPPRQLSPGGYLQPPPRARAPSGLHSLLPVLPLPPPEKAPLQGLRDLT